MLNKEQNKARMRKLRGAQQGAQNRVGAQGLGAQILGAQPGTQYHPILKKLVDPIQRDKLKRICLALNKRKLGEYVFLGTGKNRLDFNTIGELLDATS